MVMYCNMKKGHSGKKRIMSSMFTYIHILVFERGSVRVNTRYQVFQISNPLSNRKRFRILS